MKVNIRHLLASIAVFSLLISGCSAAEPPTFSITQPGQGNVLPSGHPVAITLSSRFSADNYQSIRWEIYDNGVMVGHDTADINTREIHWSANGVQDGVHDIYARGQAYSRGSNQSQWLTTPEICFWVGDNAPADFCRYRTIVQPSTSGTATPAITPIIVNRPENNNGGNGGNPGAGGGSGCGQYTDVTSCNLAGCSWNYGSCIVSP